MDSHHFMERILYLLSRLQEYHVEPDALLDGGLPAADCLPDGLDLQTAAQMVQFMDEMPGGFLIYLADRDQKIIYANRALRRIFCCESMEEFRTLTGNSFCGMVHPDDLDGVEQSIWRQIRDSQYDLDYVEYRIIRKDGAVRWIEDYGHFVHVEPLGDIFYVFLGDTTGKRNQQMSERAALIQEREEKIQALKEAHDRERASINREYLRRLEVIEGLSVNYESILYGDLDKDEILPYRFNSRIRATFGEAFQSYNYTRCISNYIAQWVCPEDRDMVAKAIDPDYIREKLADHRTYYINYRVSEKGELQYLQLRIVNVGSGEHISQIVLGCRRVDEELRQEMEQKQLLAEALDNANLAIKARNTFLSNMSHDMRTPLNAIFGFTALARQNIGDAQAVLNYLSRVDASGKQLLELINKVLELSQAETEDTHAEELWCDLRELLREVYEFLLPQAEEKGITFSLDDAGITHSGVISEPENLKHLFMYLANNAVTYTSHGGQVLLSLTEEERAGDYAVYRLIVDDNGIGISEEFLDRIFDPFTREKNTTLSGIHGIGLGLSIAKSIVDRLDGTIDVSSTVGKGSTFTAVLRLRIQPETAPESSGRQNCVQPGCCRILLVEDNEINLEIETELLECRGFVVETAEDGSIAVEMVKRSTPGYYALVLMDIQMPVMDGWQAARAIRALDDRELAGIPIVALSANTFDSDIRKSKESGMNDHLAKPIDISVLEQAISQFVHICPGPEA